MAAEPCIGCGFTINPVTGELEFNGPRSEEWPFGVDLADCNGMRCDPVTEEIWTPPDHDIVFTPASIGVPLNFQFEFGFVYFWDIDTVSLAANPASPWNTPGADITSTASVTLNNPSDCREMAFFINTGEGAITTRLDVGVGVNIAAAIQVDGGGFVGLGFTNSFEGSSGLPTLDLDQVGNQNGVLTSDPFLAGAGVATIPPGGSVTIDVKLIGTLSNPTATPFQQITIGAGITLNLWGHTV